MRQNNWTYAALALLGVVALLIYLNAHFPGVLNDDDSRMRLVYGLTLLTMIVPAAALILPAGLASAMGFVPAKGAASS